MIKLFRGDPPKSLTNKVVATLTAEFIATGKSVWNRKSIKSHLLAYSFDKCAYCEESVTEASNYMEVEHFLPKHIYSNSVVKWENLLPACKRCNLSKGKYDPPADGMIVNPADVYPAKHLYFSNLTLRYRDEIGEQTILTCNLNSTDRLFAVRTKLYAVMHHTLERTRLDMKAYLDGDKSYNREQLIVRSISGLLKVAHPDRPYAAFMATSLLSDPTYLWIRSELETAGLWDDLDHLEQVSKAIQLAP